MPEEIFSPLDKRNLGESIAEAILKKEVFPLKDLLPFEGAGIYAIYYRGNFPLYREISRKNKDAYLQPIYAGKAIPEGGRKGGIGIEVPVGQYLFKRLGEHRKSIEAAKNLNIEDFFCRFLAVDDIWIPLGESLLIEITKPLWNIIIDGFGNHDPGKGRYNQQKSAWDILHPGRIWAEKLQSGRSIDEINKLATAFLDN